MTKPTEHAASAFDEFALDPRIAAALAPLGFETPTPIQAEAMPPLLEGRDVIGRARTGSGKTAAFGLPLLERVKDGAPGVRALVLAPTRELALQVTEALRSYAKKLPVRVVTIYGGAPYGPQLKALKSGVSIVVGTPGRVLDHLERGSLDLSGLEMLVLDEADEMLRMGFLEDVEKVLDAAPPQRQVALFSATMPAPIQKIAEARLSNPLEVQVESSELSSGHITQKAMLVPSRFKLEALRRVLAAESTGSTLVFARTRAGCAEVADELARQGVEVDALHGDLNQAARERVLMRFRSGRLEVVVATDVAARGIDVDQISHVVNYDLPNDAEAYVHRIGRTGRAGREGVAISLVTPREVPKVRFLERTLKVRIEKIDVPSDADIARARRRRMMDSVRAHETDSPRPGVASLLAELGGDEDPAKVASAALALLAELRGFDLEATPSAEPPGWARRASPKASPKTGPSRPERRSSGEPVDEVQLFLPVGKKRGVRPADLVGAIANEVGIPGSDIGRVTIFDHKSFVSLPREAAEHMLEHHRQIEIRGHAVPVAPARPNSGPSAGPNRPSQARGGPPKPHRGPPGAKGKGGFRPKKRFGRNK